uniref:Uncharacterized protein n=1 Tax=Timema shepardi TaxID=629360 RepID=A0A7R9FW58_TIMSH|nr:unnamed protein product [Timema shepardi]
MINFPRVEVGPENPLRVERDGTATLQCKVDAKPKVNSVRWTRNGRYIAMSFEHKLLRVSMEDAGKYICSADNGLGQSGEAEMKLEVLYPPMVTIDSGNGGAANHREAEEGESLVIHCNVSANPSATVEWLRDGHTEFRQTGHILRINRVSAETAGSYTCRAVNILTPYSTPRRMMEKIGNASITILVRHKPGHARISPDKPIASEGSGVTLTCSATPPGWPAPQYRWWRDGEQMTGSGMVPATVLATGQKYTIPSAHLGSEGRYHCQATNEMGHGEPASVMLEVHQAPRFIAKLQPHLTRRVGDSEFSVTCGAQSKPRPSIRWLKDGQEIMQDMKMFDVLTDESENRNSVFTVQSTLKFVGNDRPMRVQLVPYDRGVYSCVFENEVKRVESSMHLRIEHEPIILHQYNKVAYDLRETAEVVCRIQAYPKPEFHWSYGTNAAPLMRSSEGHYDINTTVETGDIYTSVLKISHVREADYGEYTCRVANTLGTIRAGIRLQPKGPPERPTTVKDVEKGYNYVSLQWEPGFDGGLQNTKYFVSYRRVSGATADECGGGSYMSTRSSGAEGWQEFDCQRNNPCNVSALEQHQTYLFKVKAYNTKGNSDYSAEITVSTKVDRIPPPQRVTYDPETRTLSVDLAASCLQLIGIVEVSTGDDDQPWRVVKNLAFPGSAVTRREATVLPMIGHQSPGARSLGEEDRVSASSSYEASPLRVRVRSCLGAEQDRCSDYTEAEIGPSYISQAGALTTPAVIAIVVSCVVFLLCSGLIFVFCRCRKNQIKKGNGKDYEMDTSTVRPSLVTQQPPPPYYPTTGLENKALEHSLDLALDDQGKNAVYASQNGYGYHGNTPTQGPQGVNMGYMDNSYSNSNNGGSVNSQDSLWQMKMAAQANNNSNNINPDHHHHLVDRSNSYGYDPLTHGGYGAVDDYAPYPHMTNSPTEHEYHVSGQSRNSNNPSRQEYSSDPYAAVHKPKRRMDQHLDSPYHDVSGLPDPYMDQMDCDENKPQHISLSFDESLESVLNIENLCTQILGLVSKPTWLCLRWDEYIGSLSVVSQRSRSVPATQKSEGVAGMETSTDVGARALNDAATHNSASSQYRNNENLDGECESVTLGKSCLLPNSRVRCRAPQEDDDDDRADATCLFNYGDLHVTANDGPDVNVLEEGTCRSERKVPVSNGNLSEYVVFQRPVTSGKVEERVVDVRAGNCDRNKPSDLRFNSLNFWRETLPVIDDSELRLLSVPAAVNGEPTFDEPGEDQEKCVKFESNPVFLSDVVASENLVKKIWIESQNGRESAPVSESIPNGVVVVGYEVSGTESERPNGVCIFTQSNGSTDLSVYDPDPKHSNPDLLKSLHPLACTQNNGSSVRDNDLNDSFNSFGSIVIHPNSVDPATPSPELENEILEQFASRTTNNFKSILKPISNLFKFSLRRIYQTNEEGTMGNLQGSDSKKSGGGAFKSPGKNKKDKKEGNKKSPAKELIKQVKGQAPPPPPPTSQTKNKNAQQQQQRQQKVVSPEGVHSERSGHASVTAHNGNNAAAEAPGGSGEEPVFPTTLASNLTAADTGFDPDDSTTYLVTDSWRQVKKLAVKSPAGNRVTTGAPGGVSDPTVLTPPSRESSSESVFTDPLTPQGFAEAQNSSIASSYYSESGGTFPRDGERRSRNLGYGPTTITNSRVNGLGDPYEGSTSNVVDLEWDHSDGMRMVGYAGDMAHPGDHLAVLDKTTISDDLTQISDATDIDDITLTLVESHEQLTDAEDSETSSAVFSVPGGMAPSSSQQSLHKRPQSHSLDALDEEGVVADDAAKSLSADALEIGGAGTATMHGVGHQRTTPPPTSFTLVRHRKVELNPTRLSEHCLISVIKKMGTYSSPMASLVLADSSQLTSDSQHLGIYLDYDRQKTGFVTKQQGNDMHLGVDKVPDIGKFDLEIQYIFLKLNVSSSEAILQFMKKIQKSLYGTVRFTVSVTWCVTVVRMRT